MRWLADVGVPFIHLDPDGRILATSGNFGLNDPRLRRAQSLAWGTGHGLSIARDLLTRKLSGQARVATDLSNCADVVETIERLLPELEVSQLA